MANFIFYTDEGYTISPNNEELESFQILGFEKGATLQDGIDNLIENNSWIVESSFDIGKIKYKAIMSLEEIDSLKELINYLYNDIQNHFGELYKGENHILEKLERLKSLID